MPRTRVVPCSTPISPPALDGALSKLDRAHELLQATDPRLLALVQSAVVTRSVARSLRPFIGGPLRDKLDRMMAALGGESDEPADVPRHRSPIPPAPVLDALPRITKGRRKGERWMAKVQFAGWCGVAIPTVSDWIHTRRIEVEKLGTSKQARVRIASGERERLKPPIASRRRRDSLLDVRVSDPIHGETPCSRSNGSGRNSASP